MVDETGIGGGGQARAGGLAAAISWLVVLYGFAALAGGVAAAPYKLPRAWMDDMTGYAIGGYDPVDYFILGRANRPGADAVELYWGGVNWRFRNKGNRGAFRTNPDVYMPRFGGADPLKLATGKAVLGNPALFDVHDNRLYLFQNSSDLDLWRQDRAGNLAKALENWPRLARQLGLEEQAPKSVDPAGAAGKQSLQSAQPPANGMCEPARWSGHAAYGGPPREPIKASPRVPADR